MEYGPVIYTSKLLVATYNCQNDTLYLFPHENGKTEDEFLMAFDASGNIVLKEGDSPVTLGKKIVYSDYGFGRHAQHGPAKASFDHVLTPQDTGTPGFSSSISIEFNLNAENVELIERSEYITAEIYVTERIIEGARANLFGFKKFMDHLAKLKAG